MRVTAAFLLAASTAGAVPMAIPHQGRLADGEDHAISGSREFVFTLHTVESDPTENPPAPVWTRTYTVTLFNGVYSVLLGVGGTGDALDTTLFETDDPLFLQVKVGGDVLLPRLRVGSVPYALYAGRAAEAGLADGALDVTCAGGCVSSAEIDGTIPAAKIAAGPGSTLDADTVDGKHAADLVQNTATLQTGAQFTVSSGSVAGALTTGSLSAGSASVSGALAAGSVSAAGNAGVGGDLAVTGSANAASLCIAGDCRTGWAAASPWGVGSAGALFYTAGNVGVGTATPAARLSLGGGNLLIDANAGSILLDSSGADLSIGASQIGTTNANDFYLRSNSADRITISAAGNVGIGTTGPTHKLSIGSPVFQQIDPVTTDTNDFVTLATYKSSNEQWGLGQNIGLQIIAEGAVAGSNGNIQFLTGNGTLGSAAQERMRITNAGNVGIGTTNPGARLHVEGTIKASALDVPGSVVAINPYTNSTRQVTSTSSNYVVFTWSFSKQRADTGLIVEGVVPSRGNSNDGAYWYVEIGGQRNYTGIAESPYTGELAVVIHQVWKASDFPLAVATHTVKFGWAAGDGSANRCVDVVNPNSSDDGRNRQTGSVITISELVF